MEPGDRVTWWYLGEVVDGQRILQSWSALVISVLDPDLQLLELDVEWPADQIVQQPNGAWVNKTLPYAVRQKYVAQATTDPAASGTWTLP